MGFRRDGETARTWETWLQRNRQELLDCGIPHVVLERRENWLYFLGHGYFTPPGIAEPVCDVDRMDRSQAERLCVFLEGDDDYRNSDALNRLQFLLKRGRHATGAS
jgi:hypothetical protein